MTADDTLNFLFTLALGMQISAVAFFWSASLSSSHKAFRMLLLLTSSFCLSTSITGVLIYG